MEIQKPVTLFCDFSNDNHKAALVKLINAYKQDPMGGSVPFNEDEGLILIQNLASHPSCFVLFVMYNGKVSGLATCFINYSTFRLTPYINIHDLFVLKSCRGKGLAKALLQKVINIASDRGYCKVNLEVREDNLGAKALYTEFGFTECEPPMHFWQRLLSPTKM